MQGMKEKLQEIGIYFQFYSFVLHFYFFAIIHDSNGNIIITLFRAKISHVNVVCINLVHPY